MANSGRVGSLWRLFTEEEWLLLTTLSFLEYDGDDIHHVWLLAIEDDLDVVHKCIEDHCAFLRSRARNLAMARSWWTTLLKLHDGQRASSAVAPLRTRTVDRILTELDRAQVPTHPHRRSALTAIVESCAWPIPQVHRPHKYYGSIATSGSPPPFVLYAAARSGNLESVVWLHHVSSYDQARALDEAASQGHGDIVAWLLDHVHSHSNITVDMQERDDPALGVMAWHVGKWAFSTMARKWGYEKSYYRHTPDVLAAKCGDLDGVRRLLDHSKLGPLFDFQVAIATASSGQLSLLQFLHQQCRHAFPKNQFDALLHAVPNDRPEVFQWLVENAGGDWVTDERVIVQTAIDKGSVSLLQWIKDATDGRANVGPSSIWQAQSLANAELLHWLVADGSFVVTVDNAMAAVRRHDTELTKWIVARCIATDTFSDVDSRSLLELAIKYGNIELVRWFIDEQNAWSPSAFALASMGSSIDVLQFVYDVALAHAASAPLVPGRRLYVIPSCLDTLVWLLDHGFRDGLFERQALDHIKSIERDAARKHQYLGTYASSRSPWHIEIDAHRKSYASPDLPKLRRTIAHLIAIYEPAFLRRVAWLPAWAVQHGRLDCLQRLAKIDHPTVFRPKLFRHLVVEKPKLQHEAIVRWYLEQRAELFSTRVIQWAVKYNKTTLLAWVFQVFVPQYSEHTGTTGRTVCCVRDCARAVIWAATRHGRDGLLHALSTWTDAMSNASLWHGVACVVDNEPGTIC